MKRNLLFVVETFAIIKKLKVTSIFLKSYSIFQNFNRFLTGRTKETAPTKWQKREMKFNCLRFRFAYPFEDRGKAKTDKGEILVKGEIFWMYYGRVLARWSPIWMEEQEELWSDLIIYNLGKNMLVWIAQSLMIYRMIVYLMKIISL